MKNILFQKISMGEDGFPTVSCEFVETVHKSIKNALPADYILITSPFDLNKVDGDSKIINIDCKEYSANELLDIIENANMYDILTKNNDF
jgi:hypothetical protein